MKRPALQWWLGLVVTWNLFFVAHWLNAQPNWHWAIALLYLSAAGLGGWFIQTTPGMGRAGRVTYAAWVVMMIGSNLALVPNTDLGPAAVSLGAVLISVVTHG